MNHGDHHYFVLATDNLPVSEAFFAGLLGWELTDGEIGNVAFRGALSDRHDRAIWVHVDDCEQAARQVAALGGRPGELVEEGSGLSATCLDDQRNRFHMGSLRPKFRDMASPAPLDTGELGYFTMAAGDTDRAVSFYSELFGWTFDEPGSSGDHAAYRHCNSGTLPFGFTATGDVAPELYFRIPDVRAAGRDIHNLGGTHGDFIDSQSGLTLAGCHDPAGVAFELWQPAPSHTP